MTQEQIKQLEKELWDAADQLRASSKLTAAEYKDPVLGLVLLRFAQNKYEEAKPIVEAKIPSGPRGKREATREDYLAAGAMLLPEEAKYEFLANLPEGKDIAVAINNAMKLIEAEYTDLQGNLPKNYQEFESDLLRDLVRVFNKDAVKKATGDVFGRIYEYFLMKFSMQGAGAQEGGEFFTPPSLVQLIVNFIEPEHGIIHDPACGSGGMFVQTGYFVKGHTNKEVNEAIKCYGTEQKTNNTKLAKINLAIHGIEGKIIESNSFYSDPHKLIGKCDFVMANPPFNVSKIDKGKDFVKTDKRLPFGVPSSDNGNYLWMQYFYSYLNEKGRAGFVMASSATDAGHSEGLIRQKLIETKVVDCVVSVGNNFFYTRSLPCHLWFYDKGKSKSNREKILMIDARNVYRKVTSNINDFSSGQLANLTAIMQLYRGNTKACKQAVTEHQSILLENLEKIAECYEKLSKDLKISVENLKIKLVVNDKLKAKKPNDVSDAEAMLKQIQQLLDSMNIFIEKWKENIKTIDEKIVSKKIDEKEGKKQIREISSNISALNKPVENFNRETRECLEQTKQGIKDWKQLLEWFPTGVYQDVKGLCKIINLTDLQDGDYSLTPGRYVGATAELEETANYKDRLSEIQSELSILNEEAINLSKSISNNLSQFI